MVLPLPTRLRLARRPDSSDSRLKPPLTLQPRLQHGKEGQNTVPPLQPRTAQICTCQIGRPAVNIPPVNQSPFSSPQALSPVDLADSFWTSTGSTIGKGDFWNATSPTVEQPQTIVQEDSSGSESGYDSDTSCGSWWDSVSDSEDDIYRGSRRTGVLSTTSNRRPYKRDDDPPSRNIGGLVRPAREVVITVTLHSSERGRDDLDESDPSTDEDSNAEMKRQRRYKTPGDAFIQEQFRNSLRKGAGNGPSDQGNAFQKGRTRLTPLIPLFSCGFSS
ncbi:hypothetical protein NMY22_g18855 [Coprinellus aureogranulatus]|nr:hypothetical protein NMY22_g18855 [Coprinellus aureogranulatus]